MTHLSDSYSMKYIRIMKKRKLLIIGFIITLLFAIPATVFYLKTQQTQTKSNATPATTLSFSTLSQPVSVGQNFSLDVIMNPGSNQVSFVTLTLNYDGSKLKRGDKGIVPNATAFPTTLEGPVYDQCSGNNCTMSITVSVGADPTKVITSTTTIATINFQAIAATNGTPTVVSFGQSTKVLSIGPSDQPSENVLSSSTPANIDILSSSPSTSPTSGATPTSAPSDTPVPSSTTAPTQGASNQSPVCTSLAVSTASGSAPLSTTFTAIGSDPDGTVSKVTFNYGDGAVQDVTTGSGIGTNSVNAQVSHTYQSGGSFTATALLTDNSGAISDTTTCTQNISVTGSVAQASGSATPTLTPKLITGPRETIIGIGALGVILSAIGAFLIFGL